MFCKHKDNIGGVYLAHSLGVFWHNDTKPNGNTMKKNYFCALLTVALVVACFMVQAQTVVKVAAAANLRYAMEEIETMYESENSGIDLQINYGASGMFFQQISHGAPYNLFLSADEEFPSQLKSLNQTEGDPKVYACGKLALYSLNMADVKSRGLEILKDAGVKRIAIANPRTAPYGERSVDLLEDMGLWGELESKVIYGESISQAAQFATTGNTDLGFLALSLLLNPNVKLTGSYYIIPDELYTPIAQAGVVIKQSCSTAQAQAFFDYILSPACSGVWDKYGYSTMK